MVSSEEMEAATPCRLPFATRLSVGLRGSGLTSLTTVMVGKMAVTMVALSKSACNFLSSVSRDSRGASTQAKQYPRQEQLRVDILRLYQHPQAESHYDISCDRDSSNPNPVAKQAPNRTRDQRDQLIDEPQCANCAADILALSNALCNDEANAAVQEHEKGDAEERDAEEIRCDLRARRGESEAEHRCEKLGGAEDVIEGTLKRDSVRVCWRDSMGWGLPLIAQERHLAANTR